ncbi:31 kDa ribonucleoprotein, chloroplastic [Iris pallida]|uniref:31 kDa ribonucleoprotein, chloroplastic n=1 Tax=Iris pallida TaxID=29817 RepID=A0AAX6GR56_IRIPA|nr:31 kDa ribonucleoprotein, chloroplastic [Iris pallida]
MAATTAAAAAAGSCFSATVARRTLRNNLVFLDAAQIKVSCLRRRLPIRAADNSLVANAAQGRAQLPKVSAAVAQEESAAAAAAEEEEAAAAEVGGEEVEPEAEAEAEGEVAPAPAVAQNTKLYFGNLPYNCDSAQLAGIIQEYASPEMVEVLYERDTGRSRGFAFVTMSSIEDCEAVIKSLDGSQYGGRTLRVNLSDKPKAKEPLYPESDYKLFVGNLSWSVTSESLAEVFQEYGNVVGARVLYDGDTGRSRGYGFVCYSTKQEMDAAIESLNGAELEGRAMRISLALGKKS